jgi:hypothetical protein
MGYRTPFEGWSGRKPQFGHVKVFGCRANVRPAVSHMRKFDDSSFGMVYFGVEGSKAHRLYNPQTRRIVVSRDVIFEETFNWQWNTEFGENSDFVVDDTEAVVYQPWTGGQVDGDNHNGHQSKGGENDNESGTPSGNNFDDAFADSGTVGENSQADTVHDHAIEVEASVNANTGDVPTEMDVDDTIDLDERPVRFKNLNEVY